jgi:hypothetical protein
MRPKQASTCHGPLAECPKTPGADAARRPSPRTYRRISRGAQMGLLWVGSDDKITIGHGAVVTRFADGLPVVTEHE